MTADEQGGKDAYEPSKVLVWFSHGAASAVALKLAVADHGAPNLDAYVIDRLAEHPDNARFRRDVEAWTGVTVKITGSEKYADHWQVIEERRFLNGPAGALCTTELKKKPRWAIQDGYGPQVYGYVDGEQDRAARFREQNPEVTLLVPLIDRGLTKPDCLALLERAGIALPVMYRLGYQNNNCIGCVKGGMGYWNKIRRDFPDVFARMAAQERALGRSLLSDNAGPVYLDQLDPGRGNHADEPDIECSLLCAAAEDVVTAPSASAPSEVTP